MNRTAVRVAMSLLLISAFVDGIQLSAAGERDTPAKTATSPFPLWGNLALGPYRVGFQVQYVYDRSRTWRTTRTYEKEFSPDLEGRPIRMSIWYPSKADSGKQMRFADYLYVSGPTGFTELNAMIETHDRAVAGLTVPANRVEDYMATPVNAFANADPATGRFPLILYTGGLDNDLTANVVKSQFLGDISSNTLLAEFLASHGYVVVSAPVLRSTRLVSSEVRSATDTEDAVRDLEFLWSQLADKPNVDPARLAVIGHGFGATRALMFAMRNANVSAAIGLDALYGYKGFETTRKTMMGSYDYAPLLLRGAVLDLHRGDGQGPFALDQSFLEEFHYADRYLVSLKKVRHYDFTTFAAAASLFGLPVDYEDHSGWTRESGYRGYQIVCTMVRDFLDEKLKEDKTASQRLEEDVARTEGGTLKHEVAIPPPPTRMELVTIATQKGLDSATSIIDRYRQLAPTDIIVNESQFNSLGYDLLGQKKFQEAIAVFRLVVYTYPDSANASDSLGDGYLGAGQKERARSAFEHALELIQKDPRFNVSPQARESFISIERKKLKELEP